MITLHASEISSDAGNDFARERVRAAVDLLFAAGTIATLSDEPRPVLIGELQWVNDNQLALFVAHGDAPADAHQLTFDDAIVNPRGSVTFLRNKHVVGALHPIEEADVDDPDDYRIARQLWQEVAPLRRELIARCFAAIRPTRAGE
jgi:hypothetical protein